jgi:FkbM family methyltransferase
MFQRIRELYQEGGTRAVAAGICRFGYYDLLPSSGKKALKSLYVTPMCRFDRDFETFEYEGRFYRMYYTVPTVGKIWNLIIDGEMTRENIPLSAIDAAEPVDAIIDVGAHVGLYSVLLKRLHPDADLYAFEPATDSREILRGLLGANGISGIISDEVVSGTTGTIIFYTDPNGESVSHSTTVRDDFTAGEKPCLALSDLFKREDINRAFVKIDAEGEEFAIVDDLMTTDLEYLEGIVELHPDKLDVPPSEVIDCFETGCDQVEFLAETSPQHESSRPMYYFLWKMSDLE